jgi:hypothetical protein
MEISEWNSMKRARDLLTARDWMARFFQGRSREEIERIKDWLHVEFPPPPPKPRPGRPTLVYSRKAPMERA